MSNEPVCDRCGLRGDDSDDEVAFVEICETKSTFDPNNPKLEDFGPVQATYCEPCMEWLEETHKYEHEPQLKAFKDELEQFGTD